MLRQDWKRIPYNHRGESAKCVPLLPSVCRSSSQPKQRQQAGVQARPAPVTGKFLRECLPPSVFSSPFHPRVRAHSPSFVATLERPPQPARRQVFAVPFAGDEHPPGMPVPSLPFMSRETERANPSLRYLAFPLGSDLITSVHMSYAS